MKVFLVGFMGVGKSTLGRLLAARLGWDFVDLDARIEAAEGRSIPGLFEERGEAAFREAESRALASAAGASGDTVVACGGGAFCSPSNRDLIAARGVSVWIDRPIEAILARGGETAAGRPLWAGEAELRRLFRQRQADYALAALRVEPGDFPETFSEAAAETLLELLRARHAV